MSVGGCRMNVHCVRCCYTLNNGRVQEHGVKSGCIALESP